MLVDENAWRGNRARLEAYLDFVADMQGDGRKLYLATTSGLPEGGDPPTAWNGCRDLLVERFGPPRRPCGQTRRIMHLEPHVSTAVRRAEQVQWLLKQIGSPALRISLDISHFEVQGIDFREVVMTLAPVAGAVEVKDERGVYPDFEFLIPGQGDMDYAGFLRALADAGFDGSVSVEISKMCQAIEGYDPLTAATVSYEILAKAFAKAAIKRA